MVSAAVSSQKLYTTVEAARLAQMHPQTLRQYDRAGLVTPQRLSGGARRYTPKDIKNLKEIQNYANQGINLEGIRRIIDLENRAEALEHKLIALTNENRHHQDQHSRMFAASVEGDINFVVLSIR